MARQFLAGDLLVDELTGGIAWQAGLALLEETLELAPRQYLADVNQIDEGIRPIQWQAANDFVVGYGAPPTPIVPATLLAPNGDSVPIVGRTWSVAPALYTGINPTTRTYQWYRAGVAISGAISKSYVIQDADAGLLTRGELYCVETARFPDRTPASSKTMTSAMPRRTAPGVAYGFGRITKAGFGSVLYSSPYLGLIDSSATQPSNWATGPATTGTSAHWTRVDGSSTVGRTPVPSSLGEAAHLSDASYVFPVTATFPDGLTETAALVITPLNDVFTVGTSDALTTVGTTYSTLISGKIVEFAAGYNQATSDTRIIFMQWQPTQLTLMRAHDVSRIGWPASWQFQSCINLQLDDFAAGSYSGTSTSIAARFLLQRSGTSGIPNDNITFNRPIFIGSADRFNSTDGKIGFSIGYTEGVVINDPVLIYVKSGFAGSSTGVSDMCVVTINSAKLRYYFDNAFVSGSSGQEDWTINDSVFIAPRRVVDALHLDGLQVLDSTTNAVFRINRIINAHADGDTLIQGLFGGNADFVSADGSNANKVLVDGYIYIDGAAGINFASGKECSFRRMQSFYDARNLVKPQIDQTSNNASSFGAYVRPDSPTWAGPKWSGSAAFDRVDCFNADRISASIPGIAKANIVSHNGRGFEYSTSHPAVYPDYVTTGYYDNDPHAALYAIDYPNLTIDQIVAAIKVALRPKLDGSYKLGDGSYLSPLNPDGTWATDAPYIP